MHEVELRAWVSRVTREKWVAICARKRISQADGAEAFVEWLDRQDDLVQSLIFGQLTDPRRVRQAQELLLKDLGRRKPKGGR